MKWMKIPAGPDPIRLARSHCGTLFIDLLGVPAGLRLSGALWLPDDGVLVAGDLHLEKGSSYARSGQLLPPYDSADTLRRLAAEVAVLGVRRLVLLGDSFHDERALERLAPDDGARIRALAGVCELIWISGNHDRETPIEAVLPGRVEGERREGPLVLRHEPRAGAQAGEISGHLHPCARLAGAGGRVRRRAFLTDGARVVLPAFGAYAGGLNARNAAFAGLFRHPPLAGVLGAEGVHPIPFSALAGD